VDGSGELDRDELATVLTIAVNLEWQEVQDATAGRSYFYYLTTKETWWVQPDANAQVHGFLRGHGIILTSVDSMQSSLPLPRLGDDV
jgi:hypothetical protein